MDELYKEMREMGLSPIHTPAMWQRGINLYKNLARCPCGFHASILYKVMGIDIDGDWKDYGRDQYFPTGMGDEGMFKGNPI